MDFSFSSLRFNWRGLLAGRDDDRLPRDLTSIDLLKCVAITLMIVDHLGLYLFDLSWLRVLGRLSVPVWFFLIGYAGARPVPLRWYAAGGVLTLATLATGHDIWPLCVLFTMALIRYSIEPFFRFALANPVYFWWLVMVLAFVGYSSDMVVEYGTIGFLLAGAGYAARRRADFNEALGSYGADSLIAVVLAVFGVFSWVKFGFSPLQGMVLAAGLIGSYLVFLSFTPQTLPGSADRPYAPLVRLAGRYSLEIYVVHLLILKAVFGLKLLAARIIV